jgi:NAD(P)-dependent dehydrogenase (short-subunit alcohol dehydrogenase family)
MLLKDKVAVVTGSSQGIGKGTALRFAREGASVVINGRNSDTLGETEREINEIGAEVLAVESDVTDPAGVDVLFEQTMQRFGRVDILVNNAQTHVNNGESGPFLKMNPDGWDEYMQANLGALFRCTHQAARIMARQEIHGSIINISTVGADRVHRRGITYDSMKGAMETFTRAVAVDLAPWRIRVNGIRPGPIMVEKRPDWDEPRPHYCRWTPIDRYGYPEDIAWAVVFLASDDAGYVTGNIVNVDGGLLSQLFTPHDDENGPIVTPENIGHWE